MERQLGWSSLDSHHQLIKRHSRICLIKKFKTKPFVFLSILSLCRVDRGFSERLFENSSSTRHNLVIFQYFFERKTPSGSWKCFLQAYVKISDKDPPVLIQLRIFRKLQRLFEVAPSGAMMNKRWFWCAYRERSAKTAGETRFQSKSVI